LESSLHFAHIDDRGANQRPVAPPVAVGNFTLQLKANHGASLCATAWSVSAARAP